MSAVFVSNVIGGKTAMLQKMVEDHIASSGKRLLCLVGNEQVVRHVQDDLSRHISGLSVGGLDTDAAVVVASYSTVAMRARHARLDHAFDKAFIGERHTTHNALAARLARQFVDAGRDVVIEEVPGTRPLIGGDEVQESDFEPGTFRH